MGDQMPAPWVFRSPGSTRDNHWLGKEGGHLDSVLAGRLMESGRRTEEDDRPVSLGSTQREPRLQKVFLRAPLPQQGSAKPADRKET